MRLEWSVFQSKVARRVFYLFIISALIPVVFLAIFQITQMARQLNESSQQQVRQNVKTIGMDLIGRLFHLENQIDLISQAVINTPEPLLQKNLQQIAKLAQDFSSLILVKKGGKSIVIKGKKLKPPSNFYHTKVGLSSIEVRDSGQNHKHSSVILIHRLDATTFIFGKVKNIWVFDIHSNALFWVLGPEKQRIFQNNPFPYPKELMSYKKRKESDVFQWHYNQRYYYVGYWSLFLKQRLKSEGWMVVLAEPRATVLAHAKGIYAVFIPVIMFALLLTMLLSQAQIRRLLVPLEKLKKATKRIAGGDFSKPVRVKSGDEFEDLADAFNHMAGRLNKQFKTLSLLSRLDKSILSQQDGESILKIIFEKLKEIIDYDVLILGVLENDKNRSITWMTDDVGLSEVQIVETMLNQTFFDELSSNKRLAYDISKHGVPEYLSSFHFEHLNQLIVFPILHRGSLRALIGVGFNHKAAVDGLNNESLEDIFYRASIAFTHAEWEQRLYYQAHYDDLTKLPNRLLVRQHMIKALQDCDKENTFCVCMFIDLDNFKDANDTLGHSVGDEFLSLVAHRMQSQMKEGGILGRIGGDEFTVLLTGLKNAGIAKKEAEKVAQSILNAFNNPFLLKNMEYYATASIGITIYPEDAKNSDELLKFADMSMYHAKEKGKNLYTFFSHEIKCMVLNRNELIQEMHRALHRNEFKIYFQPKINCITGKLTGAEVLLRWQHPERGLLGPNDFLPLAEESNLINSIGDIIFKQTCLQIKKWLDSGIMVPRIAVNLSARQFIQKNLAEKILKMIHKLQINPGIFEFEVTENAFIESFHTTIMILDELKRQGCRLTLDDFGTGYSSMQYLLQLPLDTLKIDQVFIKDLPEKKKNISIIQAIKTLAQNLNLDFVAEGVETKAQSDLLVGLNCVIQQGFYFSHAITPEEFEKKYLNTTN